MIPDDCIYLILYELPVRDILALNIVTKQWNRVISTLDWESLYIHRVGWNIEVSQCFDWKVALSVLESDSSALEAQCTWNNQRVKISPPWVSNTFHTTFHGTDSIIIDSILRDGIARKIGRAHV